MIISGFHAIDEGLRSGNPGSLRLLYSKAGPRVKALISRAVEAGVPVEKTTAAALDALEADNRGALLIDESGIGGDPKTTVSAFLRALPPDSGALVVILDGITSPHNFGAILRSCDQFAVDLVIHAARGSAGAGGIDEACLPSVHRASSGAASYVTTVPVPNLVAAISALKDAGFWVYGADTRGTPLEIADFTPRTALVMGSEGSGISRLVAKHCDTLVAIPTRGHMDSLNVSVAAGILLYDIRRRNHV